MKRKLEDVIRLIVGEKIDPAVGRSQMLQVIEDLSLWSLIKKEAKMLGRLRRELHFDHEPLLFEAVNALQERLHTYQRYVDAELAEQRQKEFEELCDRRN